MELVTTSAKHCVDEGQPEECPYIPTPAEISAACLVIQAGWSEAERISRKATLQPKIREADFAAIRREASERLSQKLSEELISKGISPRAAKPKRVKAQFRPVAVVHAETQPIVQQEAPKPTPEPITPSQRDEALNFQYITWRLGITLAEVDALVERGELEEIKRRSRSRRVTAESFERYCERQRSSEAAMTPALA